MSHREREVVNAPTVHSPTANAAVPVSATILFLSFIVGPKAGARSSSPETAPGPAHKAIVRSASCCPSPAGAIGLLKPRSVSCRVC